MPFTFLTCAVFYLLKMMPVPLVIPAVVDLLHHSVCVGLLCDLGINSRGVGTDLDVCFVRWWNMPSVNAPNMHILNLPEVNYSYHTHVRPQNCSFTPEKAQNKWSTVFAETLGFVFVYNKGSGIHRPQAFFIDFPSAKIFWGCNVNYFEFNCTFVFELFTMLN